MFSDYMRTAMKTAHYEILPEDKLFYGEIPGFRGVLRTSETLEECRDELESVLEGWILLGLQLGHNLPVLNGLDLNLKQVA